jgi:hypothetical protein
LFRKSTLRAAVALAAIASAALLTTQPATAAPTTKAPPAASTAAGGWVIEAGTGECLAADYSAVYTISCNDVAAADQYWTLIYYPSTNRWAFEAAIGTCLSNFNWTQVWTTNCDGGDPGLLWEWGADNRLKNVHTQYYLVADFAHRVGLSPTAGPEQWWAAA